LLLEAGRNLRSWSLHAYRRIASRALVERAAQGERPLLVYTVNDAAEARRLFAMGVAGVFTDVPGRLRRELAGR
jgi:glycerophosphoryl diester phosphodiesterase